MIYTTASKAFMNGYVKCFDETKYKSFLIKD